jgi:hypothetical protein
MNAELSRTTEEERTMGADYLGYCLLGIAFAALVAAVTGLGGQSGGERMQAVGVAVVCGVIGLGLVALHRRRRT